MRAPCKSTTEQVTIGGCCILSVRLHARVRYFIRIQVRYLVAWSRTLVDVISIAGSVCRRGSISRRGGSISRREIGCSICSGEECYAVRSVGRRGSISRRGGSINRREIGYSICCAEECQAESSTTGVHEAGCELKGATQVPFQQVSHPLFVLGSNRSDPVTPRIQNLLIWPSSTCGTCLHTNLLIWSSTKYGIGLHTCSTSVTPHL